MFGYRLGIEEEFFLIDARTGNVRQVMPAQFFRNCRRHLGEQVTNELLQAQIEVVTPACDSVQQAGDELRRLRRVLAEHAKQHGVGILAAGTHPLAVWREQKPTRKSRYSGVMDELQMVGFRAMLCGMHVHVEVPDPARRIEIMYRTFPYLHLFLALSASSPFWQQHATGLSSYRLAASEEMPRSGLPELFKSVKEYDLYVQSLTEAGVIQDASFIWWIIRPSLSHPTLELRVADVCTRIEDALCVAALYRCLIRRLARDPGLNANIDAVDRAIAKENLWRAQRWGTGATFIVREAQHARAQSIEAVVNNFIELLIDDAHALDCVQEVFNARDILVRGSSASIQLDQYRSARESGLGRPQALRGVVDWLWRTTIASPQTAVTAP